MSSMRLALREKGEKNHVSKLTAKEYATMHGFDGGPTVKVFVGKSKKAFTLPKSFLCRHSEYFRAAFEGGFQEATSLTTNLESIEVEPFEHVLQWIGTGGIVLTKSSEDYEQATTQEQRRELSVQIYQYIDFLLAADFLILVQDPVPTILELLRSILIKMWVTNPIQPQMIIKVWELPSSHPAREFFAKAWVEDYLVSRFNPEGSQSFRCALELESVPGFANQLLIAVSTVMASPISLHNPSKELANVSVKSPIFGSTITVKSRAWSMPE